jgi:hypothetical protein
LKKSLEEDFLVPFCSEVYLVNSFSLTDKLVFLYMDTEKAIISVYSTKEQFLDKIKTNHNIKIIDIQDIKEFKKETNTGLALKLLNLQRSFILNTTL